MNSNMPIFFNILLIAISIWGPLTIVCFILYPERMQKMGLKYAGKGIERYLPPFFRQTQQIKRREFLTELRVIGFAFMLFFIAMIIIFFWEGLFYKLMAILQVASFIGAFLFAKLFPNRFFGKYK